MSTPNKTAPDFGEPWEYTSFRNCIRDRHNVLRQIEDDLRDRSRVCVNACQGMADPAKEIQAMREAIKDAHYALAYVYNHGAGSCAFPFRTEDDLCSENRFHHDKDALDALKPFIKL